jgi:tripartite-type tricarboxylate transporter receptor subunit TctC
MQHTIDRRGCLGAGLASLAGLAAMWGSFPAWAQSAGWPDKALKLVIPLPPGGGPDTANRLLAEILKKRFGQPVVVENKAGASGQIGLRAVAAAPADGLSLAYVISSNVTMDLITPSFDLLADFDPVMMVSKSPYLLLVKADSPYRTLADLIEAARNAPGRLTYGSGGVASALQMGVEQFNDAVGIRMLHVPYKGGVAATQGLAAGEVDFSVAIPASARPFGDRLRPLAVATAQRLAILPQVPTVQELIGKPFEYFSWGGYMVRKGTPAVLVDILHKAISEAVADPAYQELISRTGSMLALSASPQHFMADIRRQYAIEADLVNKLGIKAGG